MGRHTLGADLLASRTVNLAVKKVQTEAAHHAEDDANRALSSTETDTGDDYSDAQSESYEEDRKDDIECWNTDDSLISLLDKHYVHGHSILVTCRKPSKKSKSGANNMETRAGPKVHHFSDVLQVEQLFKFHHLPRIRKLWDERGPSLPLDIFTTTLEEVLDCRNARWTSGGHGLAERLRLLFYRMDTNGDAEIDWDEFITHLMLSLEERLQFESEKNFPLLVCPKLIENSHHATIRRICFSGFPLNKFITFDEFGMVCFWGMKMELHRTLALSNTRSTGAISRLMDGAYMERHNVIVVSTTNTDVRFYDAASGIC